MENEIWKDVPEYHGLYRVSNLGRVKSIGRFMHLPGNGKWWRSDVILSAQINKCNYMAVMLHHPERKPKTFTIHRLVMMAFVGVMPRHVQVDHIDGDRKNNLLSNLRYCSNRENQSFSNVKRKFTKKSKYTGVVLHHTGKWRALIKNKGKQKWLGLHETQELASEAYQRELKQLIENGER